MSSTAPGHATIGTGQLPRRHGIVNDDWFLDPELPTQQQAVFDTDAKVVGLTEGEKSDGYSPRFLMADGLGDQLKLADRRSRVFSVSLKPRAAILVAGQRPNGVFWWDRGTGKFVTSTWYGDKLPPYVADFNQAKVSTATSAQVWDKAQPAEAYGSSAPIDPS